MAKKILKTKVFCVVAPCGHPGQVYTIVELVVKDVCNG